MMGTFIVLGLIVSVVIIWAAIRAPSESDFEALIPKTKPPDQRHLQKGRCFVDRVPDTYQGE